MNLGKVAYKYYKLDLTCIQLLSITQSKPSSTHTPPACGPCCCVIKHTPLEIVQPQQVCS